jgi:hypothetical protein
LAGKYNDAQLRQQALKLTDPYDQPNLIFELAPEAALLDINNIYSFDRYPREKVFCVACKGHHHKRGFTALLTTGQRVLLGSTCGARLFGQSWTDAEKRIEERADRQFELKKLDRLDSLAASLERKLIIWLSPMLHVAGRRAAFDKHMGELASRVREAAQHKGGALTIHRKVENRAARELGGMKSTADFQEVIVGRLAGAELFSRLDPGKAVCDALEALSTMKCKVVSDLVATKKLRDRRRAFERSLEDLVTSARIHAAAEEFFTVRSFRELLRWANEHRATKARYVLDEGDIAREEGRAGGIQLSPLPAIDATLLDLISDYRRAD